MGDETPAFYICSLERANGYSRWTHQGREPGVKVRTYQRTLPLWIQVIIIIILMAFSGLFSGLNLGSDYIQVQIHVTLKNMARHGFNMAIILLLRN